jgi:transposase
MSARGVYVEEIAEFFGWTKETVRNTLHRWEKRGLGGLWEAEGRGRPRRWTEEDMLHLEQIIRHEEPTHTSQRLAQRLEDDRKIELTASHLRNLLKKRGSIGSAHVIATEISRM